MATDFEIQQQEVNASPSLDFEEILKEDEGIVFEELDMASGSFLSEAVEARTALMATLAAAQVERFNFENKRLFDETLVTYESRIQEGQIQQIRKEFAEKERERLGAVLAETIDTQFVEDKEKALETAQLIDSLITSINYEEDNKNREGALERFYIDYLTELAVKDPTQAFLVSKSIEEGETLQQLQDQMYRMQRLNDSLEELEVELDEQGLSENIADFVGTMFNFNKAERGIVDIESGSLEPGLRTQQERVSLLSLPVEGGVFDAGLEKAIQNIREQSALLPVGDNLLAAKQAIESLMAFSDGSRIGRNIFTGLDLFDVAGVGSVVASSVKLPRMAQTLGAKKTAATAVTQKLLTMEGVFPETTLTKSIDDFDALAESQGGFKDILTPDNVPGISLQIEKNTAKIKEIFKATQETAATFPKLVGDEEMAKAIEQTVDNVRKRFPSNSVWFVDKKFHKGSKDIASLVVHLGNDAETGFISKEIALSEMQKRKMNPKFFEVFQETEPDGAWFIRTEVDLIDSGVVTKMNLDDIKNTSLFAWKAFGGRQLTTDEYYSGLLNATLKESALFETSIRPLAASLRKIDKKSLLDVWKVAQVGNRKDEWYTLEELQIKSKQILNRYLTDKEVNVYQNMAAINQISYWLRNHSLRKKMAGDGWVEGQITIEGLDLEKQLVKPLRDARQFPQFAENDVYDVLQNKFYDAGSLNKLDNLSGKSKIRTLVEDERYVPVVLNQGIQLPDGSLTKHLLIKSNDFLEAPIDPFPLGYKGGGPRIHHGPFFMKQDNWFEDKVRGKIHVLSPLVHGATRSRKEMDEIVRDHELARQAYLKYNSLADDVDELITETARREAEEAIAKTYLRDIDAWEEAIEKRLINPHAPFRNTFDRELPQETIEKLSSGNFVDSQDSIVDMTLSRAQLLGRTFYSGRGETLRSLSRDVNGEFTDDYAEILNIYEATSRNITEAVNSGVFLNFMSRQIEAWAKAARPFLKEGTLRPNATPEEVFFQGKLREVSTRTGEGISNIIKLERMRERMKLDFNVKTEGQHLYEVKVKELAEWMEGKPIIGGKAAEKLMDMRSEDPLTATRAFTYDLKMGLLALPQLLRQSFTASIVLGVDPVHGWNGFRAATPIWRWVMNGNDSFLEHVARNKGWQAVHGMEADDFILMARELKKSGFLKPGGERAMVQQLRTGLDAGSVVSGRFPYVSVPQTVGRAREWGRIFVNAAEENTRIVSWGAAWSKFKKKFPGVDPTAPDSLRQILIWADDYAGNMTKAGRASWQQGAWSIPTQFLSFMARVMEAAAPSIVGAGKQFTPKQKAGLLLSQFTLFGFAGIPLASMVFDEYQKETGQEMSPLMYTQLTTGLVDSLVYLASDGTIASSNGKVAGIGFGVDSLVRSVFSAESPVEFLSGVAGDTIHQGMQSLEHVSILAKAGYNAEVNVAPEILKEIGRNLASYNSAEKALFILNYGQAFDSRGKITDRFGNSTTMAGMLQLFGIPVSSAQEYFEMNRDLRADQLSLTRSHGKVAARLQIEALVDPTKLEKHRKILQGMAYGALGESADPRMQRNIRDTILRQKVDDVAIEQLRNIEDFYGKTPRVERAKEIQRRQRGLKE